MFAGFVTKKTPASDLPVITENGPGPLGDDPGPGSALAPLEPGTLQVLEENEDITFSNPSEVGGSYEAFVWRNLLAICSGCGVPYSPVTSDTSKSNYSSSREAQVEFRRRIDQVQHLVLVFQMCRPIYQRWFATAVMSGALTIAPKAYMADPRSYDGAKWIPPKWDWVDPLKDRKAEQLALEMGVKSRDDVIEAEGEEPEVNDRRIQAARKREIDMDLGFRPVAIRENVNIAAEADDPDDAVKSATTGGEDDEDDEEDGLEPQTKSAIAMLIAGDKHRKTVAKRRRKT